MQKSLKAQVQALQGTRRLLMVVTGSAMLFLIAAG